MAINSQKTFSKFLTLLTAFPHLWNFSVCGQKEAKKRVLKNSGILSLANSSPKQMAE
jgi:hypothetical protein